MIVTITIDPTVESAAIQTIATALGVTGTDAECRVHLGTHLRGIVANLYLTGDRRKREAQAAATAEAAAQSKITAS